MFSDSTTPPHLPVPSAEGEVRRRDGERLHVLLVEDNPVSHLVVSHLLEGLGCVVRSARDGIGAVEAATREVFDIVLMDLQLPEMDGDAATLAIRAALGEATMPILAMTTADDPVAARRCSAAGMDGLLGKPICRERLAALLRHHRRT